MNEFNLKVRTQMKEADQQLRTSARCGTNSHLPPPSSLPSEFFWNLLGEFENKMQQYKHQIEDIESALRTKSTSSIGEASGKFIYSVITFIQIVCTKLFKV